MTHLQFTTPSAVHSSLSPRHTKVLENYDAKNYRELSKIGIHISDTFLSNAMDSLQPTVTVGTITTPIQFLQSWLPGQVLVLTSKRLIDEFVGIATVGTWSDEQVVITELELTGNTVPYGDDSNVVFSDWNTNYEPRTIVRFEVGMNVGRLEQDRASKIRIDSAGQKRNSVSQNLEITRNAVGFYGFNGGANKTYGFLNDPNLLPYNTVAVGASGFTQWSTKTANEIWNDILQMTTAIRLQSQEHIDPGKSRLTLAVATSVREYLDQTSSLFVETVMDQIKKNYPNMRVISAPQLDAANGGENVGYMYAETVDDGSTDDGLVFMQCVPAKFLFLGVEQKTKGYLEDYSNATAGCFVKRPWAVYRVTGI